MIPNRDFLVTGNLISDEPWQGDWSSGVKVICEACEWSDCSTSCGQGVRSRVCRGSTETEACSNPIPCVSGNNRLILLEARRATLMLVGAVVCEFHAAFTQVK